MPSGPSEGASSDPRRVPGGGAPPPASRFTRWLTAGGGRQRRLRLLLATAAAAAATAAAVGFALCTRTARRDGGDAPQPRWPRRTAPAAQGNDEESRPTAQMMLWMLDELGDLAVESQLEELGMDPEVLERSLLPSLRERTSAPGHHTQ